MIGFFAIHAERTIFIAAGRRPLNEEKLHRYMFPLFKVLMAEAESDQSNPADYIDSLTTFRILPSVPLDDQLTNLQLPCPDSDAMSPIHYAQEGKKGQEPYS